MSISPYNLLHVLRYHCACRARAFVTSLNEFAPLHIPFHLLDTGRQRNICEPPLQHINLSYTCSENMIEDHAISSAKKTECFESTASKKRKIPSASPAKRKESNPDLTLEDGFQTSSPLAKKKKGASSCNKKDEEKRSRRFRRHPPSSYLERLNRATTQRWAQKDRRSIGAHYSF